MYAQSSQVVPREGQVYSGGKSRLWLSGGGYIGTKGNNVVRKLDAFVDMWFSRDGLEWHKVSYDEGSGSNRYSSMNWAEV